MSLNTREAKERFLKNPLITARALSEKCHVSVNDLRSLFIDMSLDDQIQKTLDSWGPGDGYCIRVIKDILQEPAVIESIDRDEPTYPTVLELHPGPACPCACIFCYSKGETKLSLECSGYCPAPGVLPLTSDEIISVVGTLVEKGCKSIYFSGGLEPFSAKTTVDVLRRLPEGANVRIYTNGVPATLTDEVLELAVRRASQIRFSIHAATPTTYRVVQMPHRSDGEEIFEAVVRRVRKTLRIQKRLLDSGIPAAQIGVTFLTVPANYAEIERAVETWGKMKLNFFDIGNDALTEDPRTDTLSPEQRAELRECFQRIKDLAGTQGSGKMEVRPSRESVQFLLPQILGKRSARRCYAPLFKAIIDPYGYRWACCMTAHPAFQRKNFLVGDPVRCGEDLERFVTEQRGAPPSLREPPLPVHCPQCTEFEYTANICTEKLLDDLKFGIRLSEQPFVPGSLTRPQVSS